MKPEVQEYKPAADNTLKRKIKDEEGAGEATEAEPVKKIKVSTNIVKSNSNMYASLFS